MNGRIELLAHNDHVYDITERNLKFIAWSEHEMKGIEGVP